MSTKPQVREDSEVVLDLHTQAKTSTKLGATPEMWSFDSDSGKWKLEAADMELDGIPAQNSMRLTARATETEETVVPKARPRKSKKRMPKERVGEYDPDRIVESWITPEKFMEILAKEGEKSIAAPVKKLGYWNVDMAYSSPNKAVLLQGAVLNSNKKVMPDLQIWANGKDYYGRSPDKTAADGRFSALMVQFDSSVDIQVQQHILQSRCFFSMMAAVFFLHGAVLDVQVSLVVSFVLIRHKYPRITTVKVPHACQNGPED